MRTRWWVLTLAVIAVMSSVFTVSADAKKKSGKKGPNACALLKTPEVSSALGEGVQKSSGKKTATGAVFCNWFGDDTHVLQETLTLIAANTQPKTRFKLYRKEFHLNTPAGPRAATDGHAVAAYNGKGFVYISQGGWSGHGDLPKLEMLAQRALSRIK